MSNDLVERKLRSQSIIEATRKQGKSLLFIFSISSNMLLLEVSNMLNKHGEKVNI